MEANLLPPFLTLEKIRWKQSFTKNLPNRVVISKGVNILSYFGCILVAQGLSILSNLFRVSRIAIWVRRKSFPSYLS
jgi:hypothetical protein